MMEKSKNLANAINSFVPEDGKLAVWWIGQSGFVIRTPKYCFVTDPYLSTTLEDATVNCSPEMKHVRMTPIPVSPEDITCVDYILCSHDHGDHYDAVSVRALLNANPSAKVIVPPAAKPSLLNDEIPKDRIFSVGTRDRYQQPELEITAIQAKHNNFDYTEEFGYPYVGYIIRVQGITIYHAGDTILFEELPEMLKAENIDVGLIPVNGYDDARVKAGFQSNFLFDEAADIAKYAGMKLIIPCHYDMFTVNTEQIGRFVNYINAEKNMPKYLVPVIGEPLIIEKEKL
jgi:L-ascorbate 6-phosphate lactonase